MPLKLTTPLLITIFLLTSCRMEVRAAATATAEPIIITATLQPTGTPRPSETPFPPISSPTVAPVRGITSTQLNVRAEPSTTSAVLGVIPANTEVQIVGTDPGGNWWLVAYEAGVDGKGWVTAQFVETATKPEVPVIGGDGTNPISWNSAVVIQKLNIRSGPGTSFNSLGILNVNNVVKPIGKNSDGTWLQIEFAAGPDGKGWVNSGFVKADGAENLPIVSESGEVIGTGTPVDTPLPPTPTIVPATMDNDSVDAPAVDVVFSETGVRSLQYSSDLSHPIGDTDDWVRFKTYTETVYIEMTCLGNGQLNAEFLLGNQVVANWGNGPCGGSKVISIQVNTAYLLHIQTVASDIFTYVQYTLKIISVP